MAANSSSRGITTTLVKRVANRIWTSNSNSNSTSSPLTPRRAAYSSLYDKNPDDEIHSGPVPDDVIQATQSSKYWAPHPQTGVFGPPAEQGTPPPPPSTSGGDRSFHSASSTADATPGSVLEEKAWFRPTGLEDLEKPHTLP